VCADHASSSILSGSGRKIVKKRDRKPKDLEKELESSRQELANLILSENAV
jgi:hypothetical protein